ncbi:MAG: hypothetical protein IJ705_03010 [Oscillospiraceae bacterium]|nr:hypothetical protein [Oscillospiraceae bacterium]
MKTRVTALRLGLTFVGSFLGAGYVSGRELWQFFGRWGVWGWAGLALAMACLGLLGGVTLALAGRCGNDRFEELVIPWERPALRAAVTVFSVVFLFGIDSIMTAGAGALFRQSLGLSPVWTSLLFSLAVALFTLTGLDGMVGAFSVIVPLLTAVGVGVSLWALAVPSGSAPAPAGNGGGWLFSALTFAAYNMFSSAAILAPLGRAAGGKTIRRGVAIGTALLLLIAGLFLLVLGRDALAAARELPMLSVASRLSPAAGWTFALLLLLAMFGTAFSCFLTGLRQLTARFALLARRQASAVFVLTALVWCGSLFGFGTLIDVVYPLFGVGSVAFLACLLVHFFHVKKTG